MRRHLILIAVALLTACSYSTERTGATNDPVTGLSKETRRCIEEHLLNGWSLNLAELNNDLTPEEESALDMAMNGAADFGQQVMETPPAGVAR